MSDREEVLRSAQNLGRNTRVNAEKLMKQANGAIHQHLEHLSHAAGWLEDAAARDMHTNKEKK
jgi:hypothetical protein